ncbi:MAG TPA: hypothetical protein PKN48_12785, partial [Bacteroidales bacterium]|nr:hypothetical protein [Bacteroidales bacterium]
MKKIAILLCLLLAVFSQQSFSQESKDNAKTSIKPALLVIDIQNVYLQMVPEREKEVALYY